MLAASLLGLLMMVGGVIVVVYRRDTARHSPLVRRILLGLRVCLLLLVGAALLEPRLRVEIENERVSRVAMAMDDSLSMSLPAIEISPSVDGSHPASRFDAVQAKITQTELLASIGKSHDLHLYHGAKPAPEAARMNRHADQTNLQLMADAVEQMGPNDTDTRLGDAIAGIMRDNWEAPLTGIILFTDGRHNAGGSLDSAVKMAREARVPIYPVGVGSRTPPFNLRVREIRMPTRVFRGDRVNGSAIVEATGKPGASTAVELILRSAGNDGTNTLLEVQDVTFSADGVGAPVEFSFVPDKVGPFEIVCRATPQPGEVRDDDNASQSSLDVVDQKTKVLLWAGGPTREYRFIRNLLFRDPSMELSVYLQTARATSAQEGKESLVQFPKSREELFRYDVLVAVDPDWQAIGPESAALVEEWVSRQAAGAILVAGPVFTPALARDVTASPGSPIEALYPVVLKEVFTSDFEAGRYRDPWRLRFTTDGQQASFLRLEDDEIGSRRRWDDFPGFYWCYPATTLKPAATLLATYSDPRASVGSSAPALMATQFVGAGRVFYLGSGEMWRLRARGEDSYDRFWVRLVREMSQSRLMRGSSRGNILVDGDRFPAGTSLPVRCQILGPDYRPITTGVVSLSVTGPDTKSNSIDMLPSTSRPGFFEASVTIPIPGEYRLRMLAPDSNDVLEKTIRAEIPAREFTDPTLDETSLKSLAQQTGGNYLPLEELSRLPAMLQDRSERELVLTAPIGLWDNTWVLLAAVCLAGTEWVIRKMVYLA
ncbi:VWA domain-containing protein [bacterium]|nr:VWA domain-containing protein [bacterium]